MHAVKATYPDPERSVHPSTSDRWLCAAEDLQGRRWVVGRRERNGVSHICLHEGRHEDGEAMLRLEMPHDGAPDRAAIAMGSDGNPCLAWSEVNGDAWRIVLGRLHAKVSKCTRLVVQAGGGLCLSPSLSVVGETTWLVWSQYSGSVFRVMMACRSGQGPWAFVPVSPDGVPAFRPVMASSSEGVLLSWDQYRQSVYEIGWQLRAADGSLQHEGILSRAGVHCLSPAAIPGEDGNFFLAFQERTDVFDPSFGIHDHAVAARCIRLSMKEPSPQGCRIGGTSDDRIDLSPGLLANGHDPYRGYDGLRRRPQLTRTGDGTVWLCAESRLPGGHEREGGLRAWPLAETNSNARPLEHRGGVGYAVPPCGILPQPWAAYLPAVPSEPPEYLTASLTFSHPAVPRYDVTFRRGWRPARPDMDFEPSVTFERRGPPSPFGSDNGGDRRLHPPDHGEDFQNLSSSVPNRSTACSGEVDTGDKLFWFDLHAHSSRSPDAEGDPDELLHYARDIAGLDGVAVAENDYYPHKILADAEWAMGNALADIYTRPGQFVVFPTYEYTYYDRALTPPLNHRLVLYRHSGEKLWRCTDPKTRTLADLARELEGRDALLIAHHCTWHTEKDDMQLAEVCSSWRVCIEETDFIERRLAAGMRFGFTGSSDSHRACPGLGGALTGVFAKELTRDAIFEALKARRTMATQGQRIEIRCQAGDCFIGEEGHHSAPVPLKVYARAPKPIALLEIIRDNEIIHRVCNPGHEVDLRVEDSPAPGSHHYRVRVRTEGDPAFNIEPGDRKDYRPFEFEGPYGSNLAMATGPFAWSTPVWLEVE